MPLVRVYRTIRIVVVVLIALQCIYMLSMGPALLCLDFTNDDPDFYDQVYLHVYSPIVWVYWHSPARLQQVMEWYVGWWIPHDDPEQIFRWVHMMGPLWR